MSLENDIEEFAIENIECPFCTARPTRKCVRWGAEMGTVLDRPHPERTLEIIGLCDKAKADGWVQGVNEACALLDVPVPKEYAATVAVIKALVID